MIRAGCLLAGLVALAACSSQPGATQLPGGPSVAASRPALASAAAPAEELAVRPLEHEGVRGGAISLLIRGTPEQVLAMLLDQEHATGHRAWARRYTPLPGDGDGVLATWDLEGHLGINPSVDVRHRVIGRRAPVLVRFELTRTAFGLKAFFGEYRIWPAPGRPGHSLLEERVFIDSGLSLANASAADIAAGLREDARQMRAWMVERTGAPTPQSAWERWPPAGHAGASSPRRLR